MKLTISAVLKLTPSLFALLCICVAVLLQLIALPHAQAASLGKMRVSSALGVPFIAEIELTNIRPEEEGNMTARIASPDVFKQAGIDYSPALPGIMATLAGDTANPKIILNSASAINEPLLEILVELRWQSGRLIRQYTVLLDPVNPVNDVPANNDSIQSPAGQIASTNSALNQVSIPAAAMPVAQTPIASSLKNEVNTPTQAASDTTKYDVQRGDTLFAIASRLSGNDRYQVRALMATLLQNNPHAFINDNMNRLKAGVVLNTTDTVLSTKNINRGLAGSKPGDGNVAGASSRAFSQYKQAATQSVRPLLDKNGNAKTIKNSVKADIASKSSPTKDQLKVSGSANIGNQSVQATSKLNEAQIANDRAIAEEKSRISELEKNIKKSVEIKNSVLTTPQAIAQAAKPESGKLGAPSTVSPNVAAAGVAVATTAVATATSSVTPKPTESAVTAPVSASVTPPAVSDSTSTTPTAVSTTPPAVSPATSPAPNITKPTQPAVEEPSWYENINPMTLGGLGGVLALLGGWAVYRRKKNSESIAFSDSTFNPKDTQGGLLTAQGGQAIDTFNSVFASNFSEASMPLESAEVDPIAEADVYMQYGRDAHAEDILIDALKQNPQRHPVRLKLMELYASKGNQSGLTTQFDALSAITQATGPEWQAGKKLVEAGKVGQSNASAKVEKNATSAQSAADGDNSGFATLPMNTAIGNKPFKNTNLAIDNINLSSPTMIGDVAGNTLSSNSSLSNAAATSFNLPAAEPNALSQSPTGLSFDVQSPTILGRSNASAGLGMPAKQSIKTEPDSLLEFKVSKIDVKPEPKLPQISQLSQSSNVDLQPSSIFDKLASNSSVSATPALETKLSLAKAYTDIGDKEGARELLQEVIESGHQTLSSQAKTLLSKL